MTARHAALGGAAAALLAAAALHATPAEAAAGRHDVVTWAASADRLGDGTPDRGYRMVVHTSVGGSDLRIRLSNAFGDRPLTLDSVYAGVQKSGAELKPGSNRRLTFGGGYSVTVPAGGTVLSDALPGGLPTATNLVVSLHTPDAAGPATGHGMAMQTSYTTQGDHTGEESATPWTETTGSWFYLDAVTVRTSAATGAVVALGDSITDGWQSTTDLNRRWPDYLARRLQKAASDVRQSERGDLRRGPRRRRRERPRRAETAPPATAGGSSPRLVPTASPPTATARSSRGRKAGDPGTALRNAAVLAVGAVGAVGAIGVTLPPDATRRDAGETGARTPACGCAAVGRMMETTEQPRTDRRQSDGRA
ncbi:hypothetical protein SANTM175S_05244 [Streptomyces antimycoticus]